jgi:hypothetical protein
MREPEMIHRKRASMSPKKLAEETQRINLLADRKWLIKIDEWRKQYEWPPTRSDAIRQIVEIGLEALAHGYKPKLRKPPEERAPNGDKPKSTKRQKS